MLQVEIPVHPMSRAILQCEYGAEPIHLAEQDITWEIISTRVTNDDLRKKTQLTAYISIVTNNRLAAHLARYGLIAGLRLYKFHKHLLCRYADAQVRVKGKGHARPAIQEFLNLYGIEEDHYSLDSAYKLYQRFHWEIKKKNSGFLERMRRKPGAIMFEKMKARDDIQPERDISAELAVARFMSAVHHLMKRNHRRLEKQARAYIYVCESGKSFREVSALLDQPIGTVHYSVSAMRRRMERNPRIASLLHESLALPTQV